MTRIAPLWLFVSLLGLACSSEPNPFGPPDSGTSVTETTGGPTTSTSSTSTSSISGTSSSSSTGGTGGATASGGTAGAGGVGGAAPCVEDLSMKPSEGSNGPVPSVCHCQDEAPEVVKAIAEAAKMIHDTNMSVGCKTASVVPISIPAKTYYVPYSAGLGFDFDTGNATTGWICLDVPMPEVIHCQYHYTKGSDPITQSLGGQILNNPEDFEVVAQGDADGNGVLYTYSILGHINADGDLNLINPFIKNPNE